MNYLFYAVFDEQEDGINVSFPDLEGGFTAGENMSEALYMAKDLLAGLLIDLQEDGERIPTPSKPFSVPKKENELVVPIEVNLEFYRAKFEGELVKKTLTIPKYLNIAGVNEKINFSQILTEELKTILEV